MIWWIDFKHQPSIGNIERRMVQAQDGKMGQARSCSVRFVSVDSIVLKVFGVHLGDQRVFVLRQPLQDGADLSIGEMLEDLPDEAQLAFRQSVRRDVGTLTSTPI
jgi:hypothetical protein